MPTTELHEYHVLFPMISIISYLAITGEAINNARCHQPRTIAATLRGPPTIHDHGKTAQCQQPRAMLATTHDRSNNVPYQQQNERRQRQRAIAATTNNASNSRRCYLPWMILATTSDRRNNRRR